MDHNTLVILAENDELIPTATVRKYIQRKWGSKVSVLFHPGKHVLVYFGSSPSCHGSLVRSYHSRSCHFLLEEIYLGPHQLVFA